MDTKIVRGRVPVDLMPQYQALLDMGYSPSEIAREGVRSMYRHVKNEQGVIT